MASGPSNALQSFRDALKRVVLLLRLERQYKQPVPASELPLVEGIRGGAIVLMIAAFEAFLREVFRERVDQLSDPPRPVEFAALPDRMKVESVYGLLDSSMRGVRSSRKIDRLHSIRKAARHIVNDEIVGDAFSITGSKANAATVNELFKRVDRNDLFNSIKPRFEQYWREPVAADFLRKKLDWVVEARNEVAHGASLPTWSRDDLKEAERFVRVFARVLDDDLRIHLNGVGR